ncbi:MAG: Imm74 family immunity protein [Streptosporangiales bacterium]|jgi:hypothetical protein|nr:Imm74 family immunity protein [Streptosporangiales bacterium]
MKENFTRPEPNTYASSSGFTVKVLGRTGLRYTEGGRTAFIDSEVLSGDYGMWIIGNSLTEWDQPDGSPISESERDRILDNTKRAFNFFGQQADITMGEGMPPGEPEIIEINSPIDRDT